MTTGDRMSTPPHKPATASPDSGRPAQITRATSLLRQALNTLVSRAGMAFAAQWRATDHDPCSAQSRAVLAQLAATDLAEDADGQIQGAAEYLHTAVDRHLRQAPDALVEEAAKAAVSTLDRQMESIQSAGAIRSAGIRVGRLIDQVSGLPTARFETTWRELPLWEVWAATLGPGRHAQTLPVELMADWMQDLMPQICDWLWAVKEQFEGGWFDQADATLQRIDEALTILEQPVEANDQPVSTGLDDPAAAVPLDHQPPSAPVRTLRTPLTAPRAPDVDRPDPDRLGPVRPDPVRAEPDHAAPPGPETQEVGLE
jgi:hypothetical protein